MKIKSILCSLLLVLMSCNKKNNEDSNSKENIILTDSINNDTADESKEKNAKEFSNERFRNVTIEKIAEHNFRIRGQAQVFEATINWSVEDGHNILKDGFTTTDAGAPSWGNFDFTFEVEKADKNTSLTLVLFEISAKDGNHQYQLPIHIPLN
ncbi:Gmad2 immunoglobulin-like domain-containing protein [Flavobacterium sp.]